MRLTRLKLSGFKSFADTANLNFKANRTAIVGPNGCGKSNVIDAIRWVMGESSAKQLRGGNMQDVIFAGSLQRKPVGLASVELHFDNTYGKLGGEYNAYTELSVKRQVSRDGKSDYFLNGSKCRRRDITDIFLGTGLGPRSYAVIEQGMITRLVDAKPEEMRVFIEEAAGISRYQSRRKETVQHLDLTSSNLARLNDIAQELLAQIKTLHKQAKQAEQYQQLKTQISTYQIQLLSQQYYQAFDCLSQLRPRIAELNQQSSEASQQLEQLEIESHVLHNQIQAQLPEANQLQHAWQQAQQQHQQLLWQLEQDQQQLTQLAQQALQQDQQQQQIALEISQLGLQLQQNDCSHQALAQQIAALQRDIEASTVEAQQFAAQFAERAEHYQQQQQLLQQQQQQQQQLHYQLQQGQKTLQRSTQLMQQIELQSYQLQKQDNQPQLDQLQLQLGENKQALDALLSAEQQLLTEQELLQQQQQQLQQQSHEAQTLEKNLSRELAQTRKLLNNLQAASQAESAKLALLDVLQLSVEGQKYTALIEKMLGAWLVAEVVEVPSGGCSTARQLSGGCSAGLADTQLTHLSTWIQTPMYSLWQHVWIAEDHAQALANIAQMHPQASIISKDGFWCGVDWQINLNLDQQDAVQGQLQYRLHLDQLEAQLQQVQQQHVPINQSLSDLTPMLEAARQQSVVQSQDKRRLQQQQQQLQQEQVRLQTLQHSNAQKQTQLQQQLQELVQQMDDDQLEVQQTQLDLEQLNLKLEQLQPEVATLHSQYQAQQLQLQQLQQQRQQDAQALAQMQQQQMQLQSQQALLNQDLQFKQQRLQDLEEQRIASSQQTVHSQQRVQNASGQEQQLQQQVAQAHQAWQGWQQQLEQLQQAQQSFAEQRAAQQTQLNALHEQLTTQRLEQQKQLAEQEHAAQQLQHLGCDQAQRESIHTAQVKQSLLKAEKQLQQLGAINLAAYDELTGLQQRYDELDQQIQDLTQTVTQLHHAIADIDKESKQLFMATFAQINQELQALFPKVFEGGEASLSLEDDWQSGVKLMARPPGKRNSSLALLSGGEKTLTALALVFAIFRLNPAPFCVLDEVDAPLDDANVSRFCNLVTELSQQVQFIYITHNKLAMTMATDLLGVTMPEAGSSKLVAVSLAQAESYLEMTE